MEDDEPNPMDHLSLNFGEDSKQNEFDDNSMDDIKTITLDDIKTATMDEFNYTMDCFKSDSFNPSMDNFNSAESIKRRKTYTIQEKMDILAQVDANTGTRASLAERLGIRRSTLNGIVKNRDDTERYYAQCGQRFSTKRKSTKQSPLEDLEVMLSDWFKDCKANNITVTGIQLKERAREMAQELQIENFKASNGWVDRFKQRFNVVYKKNSNASEASDLKNIGEWNQSQLASLLHSYNSKNVYNIGEIGLYFRMHPADTVGVKGDPCHLGENADERITVILGCNADGSDKLMPVVIGKTESPSSLRNVKNPPAHYVHNKKSWINSTMFEQYMRNLDLRMKLGNRKILLFLDHSSAHREDTDYLTNIRIIFFTPNCSTFVQPLDQGIYRSFKRDYRKLLIRRALVLSGEDKVPQMNMSFWDTLTFVADAWRMTETCTIKSAFRKCGFKFSSLFGDSIAKSGKEVYGVTDDDWLRLKSDSVTFSDYVSCDDYLVTCKVETEGISDDELEQGESSQEKDEIEIKTEIPDLQAAVEAVRVIRRYLLQCGNDPKPFVCVNELENELYKTKDAKTITDPLTDHHNDSDKV